MAFPTITVKKDYDDFFRQLVLNWCALKEGEFQHTEIVITAGPYRAVAVSSDSKNGVLHLDFYAAFRVGFGELSEQDRQEIINLL